MGQKDDDKIGKKVDKFIMWTLLGGAIGSVLGMTMAPKKGKETREMLKQKGKKLLTKGGQAELKKEGREIYHMVKNKIQEVRRQRELSQIVDEDEIRKIPHEE